MLDVVNLAVPFFGLIFLGLACGRFKRIPDTGLAWMNFFIIYVTLPALFYRILARTPLEQLAQIPFIVATTMATFVAFAIAFAIALAMRRDRFDEAIIAGLVGGYGNVGYMGPGVAISTLGPAATAPVALIFCFDCLLLFTLVPLLMAFAGTERKSAGAVVAEVGKRILTNPFIVASALGVLSAAVRFEPPVALERLLEFLQNAAAPCALFTLGVTVAMRPARFQAEWAPVGHPESARIQDSGARSNAKSVTTFAERALERVPWEVLLLASVKLIVHPAIVLALLMLLGPFAETWVATAVLMAALPPALNVFVMARQYDTWVPQASSSVLFGTLASVVTLTAAMWLVKAGHLPLPSVP